MCICIVKQYIQRCCVLLDLQQKTLLRHMMSGFTQTGQRNRPNKNIHCITIPADFEQQVSNIIFVSIFINNYLFICKVQEFKRNEKW